jgi:hypothetical protein
MLRWNERATPPATEEISDNDLFTGREVKRLLSAVSADPSPYVKIRAASLISSVPRATLKSAAPRYLEMQGSGETPPIRVRRTSNAKGAHWLFHEGDCWAARRQRELESEDPPTAESDTDLFTHYTNKVSREWKLP